MNYEILYPALLIISGVLISTTILILLIRAIKKINKAFQLYPESKNILNMSMKFIAWFVAIIVFLIFLRWALVLLGLEFTIGLIEDVVMLAPKYILAALIILCGFYVSRLVKEKSKDYDFEFKNRLILVIDFIIHMTFVFTALYSIGVNISVFIEFYKVVIWVIGAIFALIVSMTIGIPLGISLYERMKREKRRKK